jgi:hypothetical protein
MPSASALGLPNMQITRFLNRNARRPKKVNPYMQCVFQAALFSYHTFVALLRVPLLCISHHMRMT